MPRQVASQWAPQDQKSCPDRVSFAVSSPTVVRDGRLNQFLHSGSKQFPPDVWKIEILKISEVILEDLESLNVSKQV